MIEIQLPLDTAAKEHLYKMGFLGKDEQIIETEKAGEGNMNVVLRIKTNKANTFILKQSRPYVQKYPQIAAPQERILTELAYFEAIKGHVILENFSPKIIASDPTNFLIVMSDLGSAADFMGIYSQPETLHVQQITQLMQYLSALHSLEIKEFVPNTAMKALNHEHIFNFPFDKNNNFDLDTVQIGLKEIGEAFKNDKLLKLKIELLGEKYLEKANYLLHGDFYPGSFLNAASGLKVIDPEFGFMGDREFDLGVLKAHLLLSRNTQADMFLDTYTLELNESLLNAYAGVEILRRILGIAQLPLNLDISAKKQLCNLAKRMIEVY